MPSTVEACRKWGATGNGETRLVQRKEGLWGVETQLFHPTFFSVHWHVLTTAATYEMLSINGSFCCVCELELTPIMDEKFKLCWRRQANNCRRTCAQSSSLEYLSLFYIFWEAVGIVGGLPLLKETANIILLGKLEGILQLWENERETREREIQSERETERETERERETSVHTVGWKFPAVLRAAAVDYAVWSFF
jgi:hypothetical protein